MRLITILTMACTVFIGCAGTMSKKSTKQQVTHNKTDKLQRKIAQGDNERVCDNLPNGSQICTEIHVVIKSETMGQYTSACSADKTLISGGCSASTGFTDDSGHYIPTRILSMPLVASTVAKHAGGPEHAGWFCAYTSVQTGYRVTVTTICK